MIKQIDIEPLFLCGGANANVYVLNSLKARDNFMAIISDSHYLYPWGSALGNPYSGKEAPAELSLATSETLQEGDNIVIISSNPKHDEILSEANRSISHPNAKRELVTSKTIHQGSAQFFLYFTKVSIFY